MAMKTPGVYVVEKNAFPSSVVEVATAVPAFVGYTEKAGNGSQNLTNKPWRITSMAEYHSYFGGAPMPQFSFRIKKIEKTQLLGKGEKDEPQQPEQVPPEFELSYSRSHTLYYNLLFFFANGGGACYIVSVGNYNSPPDKKQLLAGIDTLLKEQEPTMLIIPEAVNFSNKADCKEIQEAMLKHCGYEMKNRIAILDVYSGDKDRSYRNDVFKDNDIITSFREDIGSNFLDFGVAYYPWLNTSIIPENDITLECFGLNDETLAALTAFLTEKMIAPLTALQKKEKDANEQLKINKRIKEYELLIGNLSSDKTDASGLKSIHETLRNICPEYRELIKEMAIKINCLPPSAAMVGIYTLVDNTRGVWKAPANVSVANVISPTVNITHEEQEDLNVPLNGKSINAIRTFTGEGIKVWGARTLDGNSLDWRYINVRRTMIMLEESIKNAARAYVFEPNVANTWVSVKSMISNFLNGIWKRGGLAGAVPEDAYSVHVGLGETMTSEDILEGIMRITVLVALSRPAEFIEITFQQQMQKS